MSHMSYIDFEYPREWNYDENKIRKSRKLYFQPSPSSYPSFWQISKNVKKNV